MNYIINCIINCIMHCIELYRLTFHGYAFIIYSRTGKVKNYSRSVNRGNKIMRIRKER